MHEGQERAIGVFLDAYKGRPEFIGILLVGSLAHGFAKPTSDIDIILIATEEAYQARKARGQLAFSLWDICDYEGGYVDCKVVSLASLKEIARKGSDPARYAFQDARILHNVSPELPALLATVTEFQRSQKEARQHRFLSQLLAWKWYMGQAEEKDDKYLKYLATQKIVLFSCRAILNHNERLYPYHKWLLAEVAKVATKPEGFEAAIAELLDGPTSSSATRVSNMVLAFLGVEEKQIDWPNQFLIDSEMNWVEHEAPIDDL